MDLSLNRNTKFLESFKHVLTEHIDQYKKTKLELFVLKTNANEFDYANLKRRLLDPVIDYALSRKIKEKYKENPGTLSKKAREKFIDYINNKGELGEFFLYCFLESHLKAPKILTKLELKTSTNKYVHGADGVHFLQLDNGNFQLIYGESKTIVDLTSAITEAFKSIDEFKREVNSKGKNKSGITYEKSLISDSLEKEIFNDEEKEFIENIIYPKEKNDFEVDDSFAIFVGYEMEIDPENKKLLNDKFRKIIYKQIKEEIEDKFSHINKKINEFNLCGHNFYVYILPFTDLSNRREEIQEYITK